MSFYGVCERTKENLFLQDQEHVSNFLGKLDFMIGQVRTWQRNSDGNLSLYETNEMSIVHW